MRRVGFVFDERYLWHDTGVMQPGPPLVEPYPHWESPETKRRFKNLLDASGLSRSLVPLAARPADDEEILRLHTPEYLAWLERGRCRCWRGRRRRHAVRAGLARDRAARRGRLHGRGRCGARRPGRLGLCPGAAARPSRRAVERPRLLPARQHRARGAAPPRHPGRRADRGRRLGRAPRQRHRDGVPARSRRAGDLAAPGRSLPPRQWGGHRRGRGPGARRDHQRPAARRLGSRRLPRRVRARRRAGARAVRTRARLRRLGSRCERLRPARADAVAERRLPRAHRCAVAAVSRICGGRLVCCHEGGYSAVYVPYCGAAIVEGLLGIDPVVVDPFLHEDLEGLDRRPVLAHELAAVEAARTQHGL